ncbi:rod shape-determining protein MreC [Candidatus Kaiserbacteria bacterium]|nr:rod shape-determining protein MreC [Candidatus Kaiserbacteria bacterium]
MRKRFLLATLIIAIFFVFDVATGGALRSVARAGANFLWSAGSVAESAIFGSGYFSSRRALQAENDALERENAELKAEIAGFATLENENIELRELVRLAENVGGITAPIVSSVRASPYGTFMIGAGSAEGVVAGSIALVGGARGIVLGEVKEVYAHSALVQEVFAPGASVESELRGTSLTFEGHGGGNARAEAPRALEVREGDSVTSAQFSGRLIGIVGAVRAGSASAYQSIYIRTPVSRTEIRYVYVVPSAR